MSNYKLLHLYHNLLKKAVLKGGRNIKPCGSKKWNQCFIIDDGLALLSFDYYRTPGKTDKSSGMVLIPLSKQKYQEFLTVIEHEKQRGICG